MINQAGLKEGAERYGARNADDFDVEINRDLSDAESDGKWDAEITVTRKSDGKHESLKVSGGESTIDSTVSRLKGKLANNASPSARENAALFSCPVCGKKHIAADFVSEEGLKQHMKEWHGRDNADDDVYGCGRCGAFFDEQDEFEYHCVQAHGDSKETAEGMFRAAKAMTKRMQAENAAPFIPPLRSLAERAADGQKQYGVRNASPTKKCPKCNEPVWDVSTVDQALNKCWKCGLRFMDDTED